MATKANKPLVSIIVSSHDSSTLDQKCLDSITQQTYHNIELLVSGDENVKNAQNALSKREISIEVKANPLNIDDEPASTEAIVSGFRLATGNYIMVVDGISDLTPDYIRTMVGVADAYNSDIVLSEIVNVNGDEKFIYSFDNGFLFEQPERGEDQANYSDCYGINTGEFRLTGALYSKRIIDLVLTHLESATKYDEALLTSAFRESAEKIVKADYAYYYHPVEGKGMERGMEVPFNDGLEKLKQQIIDDTTEYVSFDIFDTLVMRPFWKPSDLFYLLDDEFKKLEDTFRLESFHNIRIECEKLARARERGGEDVSLAQIYDVMQKEYAVGSLVAQKMLEKELDYEVRYCAQRKTAKELYDLTLYLDKKVIITSDMYLPIDTIEAILQNCGYEGYNKLYVSSHSGTMKATRNLYRHISKELGADPEKILHIGDNYEADVTAATEVGWRGVHFPKAAEVAPDIFGRIYEVDGYYAQSHLGVSCGYAVALNKYFDNPFRSFLKESSFNCSPYFMGYFALGLSMLGFTRWLIDDVTKKNIRSIVFLGRDGYLPMRIFDIFRDKINLPIGSHYLPTSRKAIIPLALFSEANLAEIKTFNYRGAITDSVLAAIKNVRKNEADAGLEDIDFVKVAKLQAAFVKKYGDYFKHPVAVMDIGYSGKPEQIFAKLFETPVETYFMYTGNGEARRRLGDSVNIYDRLHVASLREKMISELGPSCISYRVTNGSVEPVFDKAWDVPYSEKYLLSNLQRGAVDFIKDYLALFGQNLSAMEMGDNKLAMQPLDHATLSPTHIDRELFRDLLHEDSVAGDRSINLYNEYYGGSSKNSQTVELNTALQEELQSHLGIKRSAKLLAGNIKRRIKYGKNR